MKTKQKAVAKSYKLTSEIAPLSFMLNSHHNHRAPLLYFDEEKGITRPLRYARNQRRINWFLQSKYRSNS